jgi:hypothetical protein
MMHVAQPRIRRMNFSISESMTNLIKLIIVSQRTNPIMKLKLVTAVIASAIALSSASASERVYSHSHHHNAYNSMNMVQAPAPAPSNATGYYAYGSYGPSSQYPGGSNLSGTGSSQFGGGAADGAGGGGGGGP